MKTQIWIALGVYLLVAIARKRLGMEAGPHHTLQILSITLFEKAPILKALYLSNADNDLRGTDN